MEHEEDRLLIIILELLGDVILVLGEKFGVELNVATADMLAM